MSTPMNVMVDEFALAASAEAQADEAAKKIQAEEKEVGDWLKRIKDAREFDEHPRAQYATDRTYVGGTAGRGNFDVRVNIAGTYVDILTAFLYAKDPACDIMPAKTCGPSRLEQARQLAKTLEIVITKLWEQGRLKAAARPQVRSGLSIAIGWIKANWHERTGQDPTTATKINDLQDNLKRLQAYQAELASGTADDPDAVQAAIQAQMEALEANVEVVLSRGLVIDFWPGEDVQVAPGCASLEQYTQAPWIATRTFMELDEAKATYPGLGELLDKANVYQQVKPQDPKQKQEAGDLSNITAKDADSYTMSEGGATTCGPTSVCVWEVQVKTENRILTIIEGVKRWARPPAPPRPATSRFYSLFQWAPIQVDGKRHPESLPSRSVELLDEYNRVRSNKRTHRQRAIPKLGFNKRAVDNDQANRMAAGGIGEMVGLDLLGEDPKNVLFPIQYNNIDPALYDTTEIRSELEMIWGIQEALSSTIRTAKTLGEAEIQQTGTQAREGHKRDSYEEMLTELAVYTAEIALGELSVEDVQAMAGPEAFWPASDTEKLTIEDLAMLVTIEIRAGSTGKPNTRLRQETWSTMMPHLEKAIEHMARLRRSNPLDVANCIAQVVIEMIERLGERIDPQRFLPPVGQPIQLIDPATGQPVLAYPAPEQPAMPGAPAPAAGPAAAPQPTMEA